MENLSALQGWLAQVCERDNLSWREASLKAGVNAGAISSIMTGARPGLRVCKALANLFEVPEPYVLYLAGHMEAPEEPPPLSPPLAFRLDRTRASIAELPVDAQDLVIAAIESIVEAVSCAEKNYAAND